MELMDLISALQDELNDAYVAADGEDVDGAKEHLRAAKQLLDDEFAAD